MIAETSEAERIKLLLEQEKQEALLQSLLVEMANVVAGEANVVILAQTRSTVRKLVAAHNSLVRLLLQGRVIGDSGVSRVTEGQKTQPGPSVSPLERSYIGQKPVEKQPDYVTVQLCVEFLLQMGYTCTCVAPAPTIIHGNAWCRACKRLVMEDEQDEPTY